MQQALVNQIDVFGYTAQTRKNCLQIQVETMYFEEGHKDKDKDKDKQQQLDHRCERRILGNINEHDQDFKNMNLIGIQNKLLPLFIKETIMIDWSGKTIYVLAIKLSDPKPEKLILKKSNKSQ